jgi:hypothetical protein
MDPADEAMLRVCGKRRAYAEREIAKRIRGAKFYRFFSI